MLFLNTSVDQKADRGDPKWSAIKCGIVYVMCDYNNIIIMLHFLKPVAAFTICATFLDNRCG